MFGRILGYSSAKEPARTYRKATASVKELALVLQEFQQKMFEEDFPEGYSNWRSLTSINVLKDRQQAL